MPKANTFKYPNDFSEITLTLSIILPRDLGSWRVIGRSCIKYFFTNICTKSCPGGLKYKLLLVRINVQHLPSIFWIDVHQFSVQALLFAESRSSTASEWGMITWSWILLKEKRCQRKRKIYAHAIVIRIQEGAAGHLITRLQHADYRYWPGIRNLETQSLSVEFDTMPE